MVNSKNQIFNARDATLLPGLTWEVARWSAISALDVATTRAFAEQNTALAVWWLRTIVRFWAQNDSAGASFPPVFDMNFGELHTPESPIATWKDMVTSISVTAQLGQGYTGPVDHDRFFF